MDRSYLGILFWIFIGLAIGTVAYFVFLQPTYTIQPPPPAPNITPPSDLNNTQPSVQPPSNIVNITVIPAPNCDRCKSADLFSAQIQANREQLAISIGSVTTLMSNSPEAEVLISKYSIKQLPTLIISGNANLSEEFLSSWKAEAGTVESDGNLVLRNIYPPYYDNENKTLVGLVNGVSIKATGCPECLDAAIYFDSLEDPTIDLAFSNKTVLEENDSAAAELILKYNITKLPVLLLSIDAVVYPIFPQYIAPLGTVEDGWFVLRNITPPYIDLQDNHSLRGLVETILLINGSCTQCFNASSLSEYISQESGLFVINTTTYDVNSTEGKALMTKYNISQIPTVFYFPEASFYPSFNEIWLSQNNTIENDGWFVFRAYNLLSVPYQNVSD